MTSVTTYAEVRPSTRSPASRYRRSLWLLTKRDLHVRYATSALGYLWSILDPLVMSGIYWFVFTKIFKRSVGEDPYIVFLLCAMLPWIWFNGSISDSTKAFRSEAKLIRSTTIPRTIWVNRIVLSKGIEFLLSIPVIAFFAIVSHAHLNVNIVFLPLAIAIQFVLTIGVSMIIAPLTVFFRDFERAIKLALRFLFYASPIIYSARDLPGACVEGVKRSNCAASVGMQADVLFSWHFWAAFNPLTGIFSLYRAAFFTSELDWYDTSIAAGMSLIFLVIGIIVFRRCEPQVLKEL
jgi:ABC-2 type transport system permease protein